MFKRSIALAVRMQGTLSALLVGAALAGAGCAGEVEASSSDDAIAITGEALGRTLPAIPEELAAPAGNKLAFVLDAKGAQIYACLPDANGVLGWVLEAPDADLFDQRGRIAGSHYAGPTWEALDGSTVVGARVAGVTVDPESIQWLLLEGTPGSVRGRMSKISYIQRLETHGGLAPAGACSANATTDAPYTATYAFYRAKHGGH